MGAPKKTIKTLQFTAKLLLVTAPIMVLSGFLTGFALVGNFVLAYLLIHSQVFSGD